MLLSEVRRVEQGGVIKRTADAQANLQEQFDRHKCERGIPQRSEKSNS